MPKLHHRGTHNPLTDEEKKQMRQMWAEGMKMIDIAKAMKITPNTVSLYVRAGARPAKPTPEEVDKINTMYSRGHNIFQIAKELKRSWTSVNAVINGRHQEKLFEGFFNVDHYARAVCTI